jgi:hypothetical protein
MTKRNKTAKTIVTDLSSIGAALELPVIETIVDETDLDTLLGLDLAAITETLAADTSVDPVAEAKIIADAEAAAASVIEAQAKADAAEAIVIAEAVPPEHFEGNLDEMVADVTDDAKAQKAEEVMSAFDSRVAYEAIKNADNDKIQGNLKGYRSKLGYLSAAALLVAIDIDPEFINREISAGSRFNVYAIDKVADLVSGLNGGVMRNAINRAITTSLFQFRAAGVAFTGVMAAAAASDKVKVDEAMNKLLVRHTVAAGTAPTQSSSSMSALQVLGIVINKGSMKFPVWQLTDTPQTRKLQEVLAA